MNVGNTLLDVVYGISSRSICSKYNRGKTFSLVYLLSFWFFSYLFCFRIQLLMNDPIISGFIFIFNEEVESQSYQHGFKPLIDKVNYG